MTAFGDVDHGQRILRPDRAHVNGLEKSHGRDRCLSRDLNLAHEVKKK
jgi:hypothetical protein